MPETPGSAVSVGADLSHAQSPDQAITPNLESKVKAALDDTFGGVDASDRAPKGSDQGSNDAGDGDGGSVTVREHKRKRVQKPATKRSGWGEEERGEDEEAIEPGEAPTRSSDRKRVKKRGERQADDDLDDYTGLGDDEGGEGPTSEDEVFETDIPEQLINAARRAKWSDDKIRRLIEHDPDTARDTFTQLQEDANRLSREYADLGRNLAGSPIHAMPQQQPAAQLPGQGYGVNQVPAQAGPQQPGQQQQQPPQGQGYLPAFQFPQEATANLEPEFVENFVTPLQQHMDQQAQLMNAVAHRFDSFIQERQVESLHMQIDQFFNGLDSYDDLYGTGDRTALNEVQMMTRQRVTREADAIRAGFFAQGRTLSVQEALEMAHNLVSSPHQEKVARRRLTKKVQKRERQITVRPTHRSGGAGEGDRSDPLAKATRNAAKKLKQLQRA